MSPYVFLVTTIVLTVASQTLQKQLAINLETHVVQKRNAFVRYIGQPLFWVALSLLGLALVSWLVVLDSMDVSKAYTLLSINYILMLPVSRFFFAEEIPSTRWFGVAIIVAGVICTAWS